MNLLRSQVEMPFHRALTVRYGRWHRRDLAGVSLAVRTVSRKEDPAKPRSRVAGDAPAAHRVLDVRRMIAELLEELPAADPIHLRMHPSTLEAGQP